ncbi:hypothetical protein ACFVSU_07705 [Microbacterium sp. NPDC058062]|uniref:hypothetical protein n=1 Tax=Microbacterium sp. NPDC058062 TaxID=3346320 RepID=UPI0036DAF5CC
MGLEDDIRRDLKRQGYSQTRTHDDALAHRWRASARAAARALGRPIETTRAGAIVLAQLKDWPANELEQELDTVQLSNAMRAAFARMPNLPNHGGQSASATRPPTPIRPSSNH